MFIIISFSVLVKMIILCCSYSDDDNDDHFASWKNGSESWWWWCWSMFGLEHCSCIKPCLDSTFTCINIVKIYTVHLGLKSRLSDDNKAKCVHVRVDWMFCAFCWFWLFWFWHCFSLKSFFILRMHYHYTPQPLLIPSVSCISRSPIKFRLHFNASGTLRTFYWMRKSHTHAFVLVEDMLHMCSYNKWIHYIINYKL